MLTGCSSLDTRLGAGDSDTTAEWEDDDRFSEEGSTKIVFEGNSISVKGRGAKVISNTVRISEAGEYLLSGVLDDGQVIVEAGKKDKIRLILDGADIHSETSACIYVIKCDKCIISAAEGTANALSDGSSYTYFDVREKEPNAVIFSDCDLKLNGKGSVSVNAIFCHGIRTKKDLEITGGSWTVNAVSDAIKAKDSVNVKKGTLILEAGNDAIQVAGDEEKTERGTLEISGGTFIINSTQDALQAVGEITITDGIFDIVSGGGSSNTSSSNSGWGFWGSTDDTMSAKGIKSDSSVNISGGTFAFSTSDDSIHAAGNVVIDGGKIVIESGDDGIHSDAELIITSGNIGILKSYEGLEALAITVNDGNISVVSIDDGLNAAGGSNPHTGRGRRRGDDPFAVTEGAEITVNGGTIYVNSDGDGIDSNGLLYVNGGNIMIDGPVNNANGALDHNGKAEITGGTLVASGSSGMIDNFDPSSTQNVLLAYFASTAAGGSSVAIRDSAGKVIMDFTVGKQSRCVIVSCPDLSIGETYTVEVNGEESCRVECNAVISSN